jgi:hypothetical protein
MLRPRSGAAVLAALAALAIPAGPAAASTAVPVAPAGTAAPPLTQTVTNQATASSQRDGHTDWVLKYQVQQTTAATVNVSNHATATASQCHRCAADGIAFQVVAVSRQNLVTLNADNQANALSSNCVSCSSFAGAYQIVYVNDQPLTQWQTRALGRVQIELTGLRFANFTGAQLQKRLDSIANEAISVLNDGPNPIPVLTPGTGNAPSPAALTKDKGPFIELFTKVRHPGS